MVSVGMDVIFTTLKFVVHLLDLALMAKEAVIRHPVIIFILDSAISLLSLSHKGFVSTYLAHFFIYLELNAICPLIKKGTRNMKVVVNPTPRLKQTIHAQMQFNPNQRKQSMTLLSREAPMKSLQILF